MSFKPDEITLMAYAYGELEGEEKEKVEEYLSTHEDARAEVENLHTLSKMMGSVKDKEVIENHFEYCSLASAYHSRR